MQTSLEPASSATLPFVREQPSEMPEHEDDIVVFQEPRIMAVSAKPLALNLNSNVASVMASSAAASSVTTAATTTLHLTDSPSNSSSNLKRKSFDHNLTDLPPDKKLQTLSTCSSAMAEPSVVATTSVTANAFARSSATAPVTASPHSQYASSSSSSDRHRAMEPRKQRLVVKVLKKDKKLGFGINHDAQRRLRISSLQSDSAASMSELQVGDVLLSVNGTELTNLEFFEGVTKLKAMALGELVFEIERTIGTNNHHHATNSRAHASGPATTASPRQPQDTKENSAAANNHTMTSAMASATVNSTNSDTISSSSGTTIPGTQQKPGFNPVTTGPGAPNVAPPYGTVQLPKKMPIRTTSDFQGEIRRLERAQKQMVSALTADLKNERALRVRLEEKNANLRKKVQKMLIECDEVRVQAREQLAAVQAKAQDQLVKMNKQLATARAQLRLDARGPNVAVQDSLVSELMGCRQQMTALQQKDEDTVALMHSRFQMDSRLAERDVPRVRDRLIKLWKMELKQVRMHQQQLQQTANSNGGARSSASGAGSSSTGSTSASTERVMVLHEGVRRLTFMKLFSIHCDLEFYFSSDFGSSQVVQFSLVDEGQIARVFGTNSLAIEDRTGMYFFAKPPMNVTYDPAHERVTLTCIYGQVNTIREMGRNIRL